jgi:hypothetical protein
MQLVFDHRILIRILLTKKKASDKSEAFYIIHTTV